MHRPYGLQGSLKRRYKHPSPTSINGYHTAKKLLSQSPAKRPTFAFADESGYTLAFANRIAHSGLHAETGAFRTGPLSLPSTRTARSRTSPGRVSERQTLPLLDPGRGALEERRKPSEQRCAHARRCSEGVAAPLGRVIFLLLSKLRLVCPVPDTSFGSPDVPACAVPVQAASQLGSFRLGVQWFSVETGRIFCYNFGKRVT